MNPRHLLFASVGVLAIMAGMLVSQYAWMPSPPPVPEATGLVGQPRPPFTLGDTEGRQVSVAEFDGQVLLINFWATWCTPCRAEMPMLVQVQDRYAAEGLSVVGIALDDVQQARDFARDLGVSYTVLVGGADVMAAGVVYGNRAGMLPYTVLIDREGIVRWTHLGELEREELEERLQALL